MKTTRTIRAADITEGDRLSDDHVVFSRSPSITEPDSIAVGAGLDEVEMFTLEAMVEVTS